MPMLLLLILMRMMGMDPTTMRMGMAPTTMRMGQFRKGVERGREDLLS